MRYMRLPVMFVCLSVSKITKKTRVWIWMKFCTSTSVGTWTNWPTFEPDPDHSPDTGTGKSESRRWRSRSNKHITQSRLHVTRCTAERYCLLQVVVQLKAREFGGLGRLFCTTYGCGATGRQTCPIFGFWPLSEVHALHRVPSSYCYYCVYAYHETK